MGHLDAVIPCGCDLELFRLGTKEVRPTVLFVGTWEGRKRGRLVAEAFERVVRPRVPDARLWMVVDRDVHGPKASKASLTSRMPRWQISCGVRGSLRCPAPIRDSAFHT